MPEFNVPPARTAKDFADNIGKMLSWLGKAGEQLGGLSVDCSAARFFAPSQLAHEQAQRFGCDPDFCVWTRETNRADPASEAARQMRTAGAHIHVSFTYADRTPEVLEMEPLVKSLDLAMLPFVIMDRDAFRRQLYGKAGAFRPKKYTDKIRGIEYRVLSNYWISSPELAAYTFNQVAWAINFLNAQRRFPEEFGRDIQKAINNRDENLARKVIGMLEVPVPAGMEERRV
jgi:hypothetical protein